MPGFITSLYCLQTHTSNPHAKQQSVAQIDSTTNTHCDYEYYSQILSQRDQTSDKLKSTKDGLNTKLLQLQTLVNHCDQLGTLNTVKTHIQAAITVIKALTTPHPRNILPIKRKIAPNANNITQPTFFSTKKKRKTTSSLKKTTHQQVIKCEQTLTHTHPIFCGKCLKETDMSTKTDTPFIRWIQCDHCDIWLHFYHVQT